MEGEIPEVVDEINLAIDLRAIADSGLADEFNALIRRYGGYAFLTRDYEIMLEVAHNHIATVTADKMLPFTLWGPN